MPIVRPNQTTHSPTPTMHTLYQWIPSPFSVLTFIINRKINNKTNLNQSQIAEKTKHTETRQKPNRVCVDVCMVCVCVCGDA